MDRGAWRGTLQRVTKSRIRLKRLSMHAFIPPLKHQHFISKDLLVDIERMGRLGVYRKHILAPVYLEPDIPSLTSLLIPSQMQVLPSIPLHSIPQGRKKTGILGAYNRTPGSRGGNPEKGDIRSHCWGTAGWGS